MIIYYGPRRNPRVNIYHLLLNVLNRRRHHVPSKSLLATCFFCSKTWFTGKTLTNRPIIFLFFFFSENSLQGALDFDFLLCQQKLQHKNELNNRWRSVIFKRKL